MWSSSTGSLRMQLLLFQQLVSTPIDCNVPPASTRTVLRRTVELFSSNIAQPMLSKFLCNLDAHVSPTIVDGCSSQNLKGFYIVTVHWVDTFSGQMKSSLLTILNVSSSGTYLSLALLTYLAMDMHGGSSISVTPASPCCN